MQLETRDYLLTHFGNKKGGIDCELVADFFGVSARTVRHWWRIGCPSWVDKFVALASKSLPNTKEWEGFSFNDNRLITPFKRLTFSSGELLMIFYDRQFNAATRSGNAQLTKQIDALRDQDETRAINQEIDDIISTLNKLKNSPVLAEKRKYHKAVARDSNGKFIKI